MIFTKQAAIHHLYVSENSLMKNIISERVADFLEKFPPFSEMHEKDLQDISSEISIIYKEKGSTVFYADEEAHENFYMVHKGAVDLRMPIDDTLVDICDEGDIFGLRPLMANENYKLEAKAREDTILYGIPIAIFKPYIQTYEELGNFIIESFASNTRNPYSKDHTGKLVGSFNPKIPIEPSPQHLDLQPVPYSKKTICCPPSATARSIAKLMSKKQVGSVLVVEKGLPIGIITDRDLRTKIVTGQFPVTASAGKIMTSPVITYPTKLTITQAHMAMMKSDIGHICLTEDGTTNTRAVGIVSMHDIMVAMGNNPAALLKAVKRSKKVKQIKQIRNRITGLLKGYLDHNIPMSIILKIISELNDTCMKQIIQISLKKMPAPPVKNFAWMAMGSQGRGEQLLLTDQDNALVFGDVPDDSLEETTGYFLKLAKLVNKGLLDIGYEYCPAEMMASNPKWCLSLGDWKRKITQWMANPGKEEVLLSSIFFDYNFIYGDKTLTVELSEHIFQDVEKYPLFSLHLAAGALQNPSPTGFFRQFLVEQDGKYKDFFDLKRRGLMPLTDAARVLIFAYKTKQINNTADRFEKLAELDPNNRELYQSCAYAVKALLKFRTKQGLAHQDPGRFIALDKLSKEEKIKLKSSFKTIRELQELLATRFNVTKVVL